MMGNRIRNVAVILLVILMSAACSSPVMSPTESEPKESSQDGVYKVVIDPGHGGKDVGAIGASGQYEKDFTLSLSLKIRDLLAQDPDIDVYMTRSDDTYLSQESRYRTRFANDLDADVFVSIHGNTFADPTVSGTETFYYHKGSRSLAALMQEHVAEATGFPDRGIKKEEFFVVKETKMPAVLIEIGYLTNPIEEREMWSDPFQARVASAIAEGIRAYF